eukprot:snap_masked-scaffold_59-processed-gene-0.47-mRNA-1 protein AED:0.39 eAED:0.39 QI:0/0/0/0.5/1/1/2/0/197
MVHAVNQKLNVEFYIWRRPLGSRYINKDVQEFSFNQEEKPDVFIVDLPFKMFSSDPVRGPKVEYDVLDDAAILNLDVNGLPPNNMWFVWTVFKKRELVLKWMAINGIKFLSRLIWVKVNEDGRILSTLGNVTGACTEEVLIGKEVFYGVRRGNSEKPVELYQIIENVFNNDAVKWELFGRNNNLRRGWLTVGNQVGF